MTRRENNTLHNGNHVEGPSVLSLNAVFKRHRFKRWPTVCATVTEDECKKNVTKERPQKVKSSGGVHPVLAIVIQKFRSTSPNCLATLRASSCAPSFASFIHDIINGIVAALL